MNDEARTSVGIEDLLAEEDEQQSFVLETTNLRTGAGGNATPEVNRNASRNPNATRWLFNPFEFIDLRNEPTGCGMSYLENIVFNRVVSLDVSMGKDIRDTNSNPVAGMSHSAQNYTTFSRTAEMIALELVNKNGDKGVVDIPELIGEEEGAGVVNKMLFGEQIECVVDINHPEFPCPVLPNLLEVLQQNVRTNINSFEDPDERTAFAQIARRVRDGIAQGVKSCRLRIEEAQKRLLDEKSPNRFLSHAEQRCYLALGEQIPNQMPFLTKSAVAGQNMSGNDIAAAVTAGVVAAMGAKEGVATPAPVNVPSDFVPSTKLDELQEKANFEVEEADIAETATKPAKKR